MINIERLNSKQVELADLKRLKRRIEYELYRVKPKQWIILLAVLTLLLSMIYFGGGKEDSGAQEAAAPSVDEVLSDDKAGVQTDNEVVTKEVVAWGEIIAGLRAWMPAIEDGEIVRSSSTIKVPEEAGSIQEAIDRAQSGDVVLVSAGEYKGNITMKDGVSLVGESAATVILSGGKKGNVVAFKDIDDKDTRLENLTIRDSGENLSGILIENSSPLINRNVVLQNYYDIFIKGESSPTIQRNRLSESRAGVQIFNLQETQNSHPVILDNLIFGNKKGINIYKGTATIEHNTLSFNNTTTDSGATFGVYLAGAAAVVRNNIITDNGICELCSGVYADEDSHDVLIDYNDLWNNQSNFVCFGTCEMGEHNLSEDPLFTNGVQYDFNLGAASPFLGAASDGQKLGSRS